MSIASTVRTKKPKPDLPTEKPQPDLLTEAIQSKLGNPERSSDVDLRAATNQVLKDVGMSTTDSGGKVTFYGRDPIIPSPHRFGSMAAIGLAAKAVAVAALWQLRTGEGQDIAMDVRKALRRFCGFFDGKWETINGRPPIMLDATNPFFHLPLFRETRDGRYVVALNFYPKLCARALNFLSVAPASNLCRTQFCSGAPTTWRTRRPRRDLSSERCAPSTSSRRSVNIPRCSPGCR